MVVVEPALCTRCGLCATVCHQHCLHVTETGVAIGPEPCSTCAQCIAVCPERALSWDGVPPEPFDKTLLPTPEQTLELFQERRTTRFFAPIAIERPLIEQIVATGILAPTNNYQLHAVIIDRRETMQELDRLILQFVHKLYRIIFRPKLVFELLRKFTSGVTLTDKTKMERDLKRGSTTRNAAATVFLVGDKRIGLSEDSAQYALYNMILYAHVLGIGTRLRGPGPLILDRSKAARAILGLGRHEHILGMLEMGYPEIEFSNKVHGKSLPVRWAD